MADSGIAGKAAQGLRPGPRPGNRPRQWRADAFGGRQTNEVTGLHTTEPGRSKRDIAGFSLSPLLLTATFILEH